MSDYINRADAIEKLNNALKRVFVEDVVTELLNSIPPADVAPVVRCRECKYAEVSVSPITGLWCTRFRINDMAVGDDDFCSYGERKDDETI